MDMNDTELDNLFEDDFQFKPITKGLGFHHGETHRAQLLLTH